MDSLARWRPGGPRLNHFQSLAALAWAYRQTGQTSRQHQMYQTLINRAEAVPVDASMPALFEARQALHQAQEA